MRKANENPPAKEKFLETAQRLMLANGYTATTIDDICAEAGLKKGSFFHYFKSKEDLGKAALNRYVSEVFNQEQEADFFSEPDPLKKIYGYLDYISNTHSEPDHQQGCLLASFAQVLSDSHPEIRQLCEKHFSWWAGLLKEVFDDANALYAPGKAIDTHALAEHVISVIEGSQILARAKQDSGVVVNNIRNLKAYLETIFEE